MSVSTKEQAQAIKRKLAELQTVIVAGVADTDQKIVTHTLELIDLKVEHNKRINDAFVVIKELTKRIKTLESGVA